MDVSPAAMPRLPMASGHEPGYRSGVGDDQNTMILWKSYVSGTNHYQMICWPPSTSSVAELVMVSVPNQTAADDFRARVIASTP